MHVSIKQLYKILILSELSRELSDKDAIRNYVTDETMNR